MNCIGVLEYKSISAGIEACDIALKAGEVKLIYSLPVCAGKYMIVLGGEVGDVKSALEAASSTAPMLLIDTILIPNLHKDIIPAMTASTQVEKIEAVGVVESFSLASAILSADIALKAAEVNIIEIRIAKGLGGKAYFILSGEIGAIRESCKDAVAYLKEEGFLVYYTVLANPHKFLAGSLY
ncbi:MAG: BMC domain-containing protein [Candidatus Muiribacteriota bacterium]